MYLARFVLGLAGVGLVASAASANINLEWRPAWQAVPEGESVYIGLYAVSDDDSDQCLAAMDVILEWDPTHLQLVGVHNDGPYGWLFSGFPNDSALDGLNDSWTDGNALYQALAQLGVPAIATPDGLLVTTFEFLALTQTPIYGTTLIIPETYGHYARSRVFDCEIPGYDVHGTLGTAVVRVLCANGCVGDLDGDCDVDQSDLGILLASWHIDAGGDLDGDGETGQSDLGILLADWGCGVGP